MLMRMAFAAIVQGSFPDRRPTNKTMPRLFFREPKLKVTCAVDTGFAIAKTGNFCQLVFMVVLLLVFFFVVF